MGINLGNSSISSFKLGSNSVSKVYLGNNLIWPSCTESSLLLHFDGNNGDTSTSDSSINNLSTTVSGDAIISTNQSKFGTSSISFSGSGSLTVPYDQTLNLSTGDWTVEFWWFPTDETQGTAILFSLNSSTGIGGQIQIQGYPAYGHTFRFLVNANGSWLNTTLIGSFTMNQWTHIAAVRSGQYFSFFINGVLALTYQYSGSLTSASGPTIIGNDLSEAYGTIGYIDEVRITKGLCVYSSDFIPSNYPLNHCSPLYPVAPYGTYLFGGCIDGNLTNTYADGVGGRYTEVISQGSCTGWDGYYYYIDGVKTNLPQSGTGIWNNLYYVGGSLYTGYLDTTDKYYLNGVETTLNSDGDGCWDYGNYNNGSVVPPQNAGYDSCSEIYWLDIGGVITDTSLDSNGNGYWNLTDKYYIGGVETTLDSSGSGYWNNQAYFNGNAQSTGWNTYHYYIDNTETNLDSTGSGYWNNQAYWSGNAQSTGWNGYSYYIDNTPTDLNSYGTGDWNNLHYENGNLYTGYYGATYYINGVGTTLSEGGNGYWATTNKYYLGGIQTTLNSDGDGCYNNNNYVSGSIVSVATEGWDVCTNKYYLTNMYGALSETPLSSNGDGWWGDMNLYYLGGIPAYGLDSNGDGCSNGYIYYGGVISEETC